jgi:replicative DNA helicase
MQNIPKDVKFSPVSEIRQKEDIIPNGTVQELASEEELMFLNLMLHNKDLLQDTFDSRAVTPDHFFWEQNARFYSIIMHNFLVNDSLLTRDNMYSKLRNSSNSVAAEAYYNRVEGMRVSPEDYERLRKGMVDRFLQQRFYELTASNQDGVSGVSQILDATKDQSKLLSKFIGQLVDLESDRAISNEGVKISELSDTLDIAIRSIDARRVDPEVNKGFQTGYRGLDDVTNGFYPKDYIIIVGYPNGGKTTFMLNLAMGLAECGATGVYVTVESNEQVITERMLAKYSKVESKIIKKGGNAPGEITPDVWNKIANAKEYIDQSFGNRFTFITVPQKTPVNVVTALIEKKRRKIKSAGGCLQFAFVDYLDVIDPVDRYPNHRDLEIGDVSVRLQAYGRTHDLVMVTAQSFNNEMIKAIKKQQSTESADEGDVGRVVGIEGVGGTQKLSRDADYIFGLILGNHDQKMYVYWMKSRASAKDSHFALTAHLEICSLTTSSDYIGGEGVDLNDFVDIDQKAVEDEKIYKEAQNLLSNADRLESTVGVGPARKRTTIAASGAMDGV